MLVNGCLYYYKDKSEVRESKWLGFFPLENLAVRQMSDLVLEIFIPAQIGLLFILFIYLFIFILLILFNIHFSFLPTYLPPPSNHNSPYRPNHKNNCWRIHQNLQTNKRKRSQNRSSQKFRHESNNRSRTPALDNGHPIQLERNSFNGLHSKTSRKTNGFRNGSKWGGCGASFKVEGGEFKEYGGPWGDFEGEIFFFFLMEGLCCERGGKGGNGGGGGGGKTLIKCYFIDLSFFFFFFFFVFVFSQFVFFFLILSFHVSLHPFPPPKKNQASKSLIYSFSFFFFSLPSSLFGSTFALISQSPDLNIDSPYKSPDLKKIEFDRLGSDLEFIFVWVCSYFESCEILVVVFGVVGQTFFVGGFFLIIVCGCYHSFLFFFLTIPPSKSFFLFPPLSFLSSFSLFFLRIQAETMDHRRLVLMEIFDTEKLYVKVHRGGGR